jgi:nucleoside-diphosphate-sugar epimerase
VRIFVTGANGFVGTHLVEHLLHHGHVVTAGVRSSGTAPSGAFETVVGEIGPDTDWSGFLAGHDTVIHLAARVHVMNDTSADPLEEFRRVNSLGTSSLAQAASGQGVDRFVFLSSIKVNGESTAGVPFTAHDHPAPVDPYGISKHEAEGFLRSIERESGLDVVVVRTPLVYGPNVGGNFVKLLSLADKNFPLPLGSISNRRTMTSVWNLVDLLEKASTTSGARGDLILAGDKFSPSTAQLSRQLSLAMGRPSRIFPFPLGLLRVGGRVTGRLAVVSRLTDSLEVKAGSSLTEWGWNPPHSFEDSIDRTVAWYLNNKQAVAKGGSV